MLRQFQQRVLAAALTACVLTPAGVTVQADPAPFMMRATVGGELVEGQPIAWSQDQMLLLSRDGALHDFHPGDAKEAQKTDAAFAPYSTGEMTARLRDEFGRRYDVSTSPHFLVVHPRGQGSLWARRLESLLGTFAHYMNLRGFRSAQPPVPLVAVVFRSQDDYYRHAESGGAVLQPGTRGHYDPASNRIFLFDAGDEGDWSDNAATIIHEAVHQAAYNIGVHRRFAEQPRWAVEGLAMMFEARGAWDPGPAPQLADRINAERLDYFRRTLDLRPADWVVRAVTSDRGFGIDALNAYAEAWTLSFYLSETRAQQYSGYLARVAAREPFTAYPAMERITDFSDAFGGDFKLLAAQVQRFIEQLP